VSHLIASWALLCTQSYREERESSVRERWEGGREERFT
jgi:hypothetical protein